MCLPEKPIKFGGGKGEAGRGKERKRCLTVSLVLPYNSWKVAEAPEHSVPPRAATDKLISRFQGFSQNFRGGTTTSFRNYHSLEFPNN